MFDHDNNDHIPFSNCCLYLRFPGLSLRGNPKTKLTKATYITIYSSRYSIHIKIYISKYLYIKFIFVCELVCIVLRGRDNTNQEFCISMFLIQYNYILYYVIPNSCQFLSSLVCLMQ